MSRNCPIPTRRRTPLSRTVLLMLIAASPCAATEQTASERSLGLALQVRNERFDKQIAVARKLAVLGPEAIPSIRPLLVDSDKRVRRGALRTLFYMGKDASGAVEALVPLLKDGDATCRELAADALGEIGPQAVAAVDALIETLADPDHSVVESASQSLAKIGALTAPSLYRLLGDPKRKAAYAGALLTLGRIQPVDSKSVTEVTRQLIHNRDQTIREPAIKALGEMGSVAAPAVPALTRLLNEDADLRWCVLLTLGMIGSPAADSIPSIRKFLDDKDTGIRRLATEAITSISHGQNQPARKPLLSPSGLRQPKEYEDERE